MSVLVLVVDDEPLTGVPLSAQSRALTDDTGVLRRGAAQEGEEVGAKRFKPWNPLVGCLVFPPAVGVGVVVDDCCCCLWLLFAKDDTGIGFPHFAEKE